MKVLRAYGVRLDPGRGKGSHGMLSRDGHRPYPLPIGKGMNTEVRDRYIEGACEALGLDLDEVMQALRGGSGKR